MLVEKGGAFDLKFRPGGNRGGATHSNARVCVPPRPPPLRCEQELQSESPTLTRWHKKP